MKGKVLSSTLTMTMTILLIIIIIKIINNVQVLFVC